MLQEKHLTADIFSSTEAEFSKTFKNLKAAYTELKGDYKKLDAAYFTDQDEDFKAMEKSYTSYFMEKLEMRTLFAKGTPSPTFSNYENHNGKTSAMQSMHLVLGAVGIFEVTLEVAEPEHPVTFGFVTVTV